MANRKHLQVRITGDEELAGKLKALADFNAYRPTVNALVHGTMKMQVRDTFNRQADPATGMPWKPVSAFGNARGPRHKILQSSAGAGLLGSLMAAPLRASGNDVWLAAPDSVVYGNIHQYGGEIKPRQAKYLALPITPEARRLGSPRQMSGKTFGYRAKTGKQNLFIARSEEGKLVLHWLLLKNVMMPARPYFGWSDEYALKVGDNVAGYIARKARELGFKVEDA